MNRNSIWLLVLLVLAVLLALGCGENAIEPAGRAEVEIAGADMGSPDLDAAGGRGHGNPKGTFLISSRAGIIALSPKGESFLFHPSGGHAPNIEVLGTRIFWLGGTTIYEFDHLGNILATIDLPARIGYGLDFTVLPDGNFAVHDCRVDSVYFMDPAGTVFRAVAMPEPSPMNLQNMKGLVLDGRLIVSETGTRKIAAIDLATYETSIFRDFSADQPHLWLNNIEHQGNFYYIGRAGCLQRFKETGHLRTVAEFDEDYNLNGFAVLRHKAYAAFNHTGRVLEVNLSSGKTRCLLEGLDYPTDVEFIPVVLEPPVAARMGPQEG